MENIYIKKTFIIITIQLLRIKVLSKGFLRNE